MFQRKSPNLSLPSEIYNQALEFLYYVSSPRNPVQRVNKRIRWEKPPAGWKKLNTDGSSMSCMERAGCGGTIKDEHGSWVAGFTRHIGLTNSFVAELWELRDGLILCCNMNISCLIVEIDAKMVVDVLKNSNHINFIISPILEDCRLLASRFHQIQFSHCFREANRCADMLAKIGAEQEAEFILLSSPPVDLFKVLEDDCNGVFSNRLCTNAII